MDLPTDEEFNEMLGEVKGPAVVRLGDSEFLVDSVEVRIVIDEPKGLTTGPPFWITPSDLGLPSPGWDDYE